MSHTLKIQLIQIIAIFLIDEKCKTIINKLLIGDTFSNILIKLHKT